jgi:putative nucleotidyltransferase with HDIG domain
MNVPFNADIWEKRVDEMVSLPTLPGVVRLISTMVENEKSSAAEVSAVISKDQVLSAKLLRLVNSPIYGFPGRISSVSHALVLLGFNVVKGLVLGTTVFDHLAKDLQGIWEHSLGTAVVSRRMAKELKMGEPEEIMICGLLHDLGKVVLSHIAPQDFKAVVKTAELKHVHILVAEQELLHTSHTHIAGLVARRWHLPARLTDAIVYHHHPMEAEHSREVTAVVHLADILARGMGYGSGGDSSMPELDHEAFQMLGLSYAQIDLILADAEHEFRSGIDLFMAPGKAQ